MKRGTVLIRAVQRWDNQRIAAEQILAVLDRCSDNSTSPMLDNGYVYLAATRLSLYRTADEWAMVIDTFDDSPRSGLPDTCIYTLASTVYNSSIVTFQKATRERYSERSEVIGSR
jgi:hypothetical protein